MNIVVAALTTGVEAAVSQAQQTAQQQFQPQAQPQQFQTTVDDEQSLERETDQHRIGVNKIDSDIAGSKQEKCDEISNEMKSMLIKKRTHNRPKQSERRSARRTAPLDE